ncbi:MULTISPECIES: YqxA family protein [Robertmurraya]|nr:YqxA family protein [Robertmurraya siralis]
MMKLFFLKFVFVLALMFVSVLFGMQQANEGIDRMKGFEDHNFKEALHVTENEGGEVELAVLGNDISSHDIQEKKAKLEKMKAYNFFSSIGKKLAEGVSSFANKAIELITELFQ